MVDGLVDSVTAVHGSARVANACRAGGRTRIRAGRSKGVAKQQQQMGDVGAPSAAPPPHRPALTGNAVVEVAVEVAHKQQRGLPLLPATAAAAGCRCRGRRRQVWVRGGRGSVQEVARFRENRGGVQRSDVRRVGVEEEVHVGDADAALCGPGRPGSRREGIVRWGPGEEGGGRVCGQGTKEGGYGSGGCAWPFGSLAAGQSLAWVGWGAP